MSFVVYGDTFYIMSIKFAHISPTPFLKEFTKTNGVHLVLAHLLIEDPEYLKFYQTIRKQDPDFPIHVDCSAFELFKQGKPYLTVQQTVDAAKLIGGNPQHTSVVIQDFPKEDWRKTVQSFKDGFWQVKDHGFKTFFVPQSEVGDWKGYTDGLSWAIENGEFVDYIGLSILGCPIAMGIEEGRYPDGTKQISDTYKLQRYLARWKVLHWIDTKYDRQPWKVKKKFHLLGMSDGPHEIPLLQPFDSMIFSMDSSSAVWAGLNGILYDNSPTGLFNGKFEKEVDFNFATIDDESRRKVLANIARIDMLANNSY